MYETVSHWLTDFAYWDPEDKDLGYSDADYRYDEWIEAPVIGLDLLNLVLKRKEGTRGDLFKVWISDCLVDVRGVRRFFGEEQEDIQCIQCHPDRLNMAQFLADYDPRDLDYLPPILDALNVGLSVPDS